MSRRVAFVHRCAYPFGGAERVTSDLAAYLAPRGWKVCVLAESVNERLLTDRDRHNIESIICSGKSTERQLFDFIIDSSRQHRFDIIIIQSALLGHIGCLASRIDVPVVFSCHGVPFWEEQAKWDRLRIRSASNPAKQLRYLLIQRPLEALFGRIHRRIEKQYRHVYTHCDAFIVLCDAYRRDLIDRLGLPETNRVHTIPNAQLPPPEKADLSLKRKEVLYLGRLSYADKRVDRLLDIWQRVQGRFPDWRLDIVGDGTESDNLRRKAEEMHLERIVFHTATATPWEYYRSASIFCLVSSIESWGLVLTEAQQAGAIPVAFDCSAGVREIVAPSWECGVLVPPFDLDAYSEALARLMQDEELRRDMAEKCICKSELYSLDRIGAQWEQLLEKLIAARQ